MTAVVEDVKMTSEEAAAYLGIALQTLLNWRATRRESIPYLKLGRLVRYRKSDLDKFIEKKTVGALPPDND